MAFDRAYQLFQNKECYSRAMKNAFESAIDVIDVARAWCKEFYRLRSKVQFWH